MSKQKQPILACWSLTIPVGDLSPEKIKEFLKKIAKKWGFQKERGSDEKSVKGEGFLHYQIQFSLIKKTTRGKVSKFCYDLLGIKIPPKSQMLSPMTTNVVGDSRKNQFEYVCKLHSRVEGPWTWEDPENSFLEIPNQIKCITVLYPYQQKLLNFCQNQLTNLADNRTIHSVNDLVGNAGKSVFCTWMEYHKYAVRLPFNNCCKDLLQAAMKKKSHAYLIDIPRSVDKRKLEEFFTAVEFIKDGYVYDARYHYKERFQSCPCVIIFCNEKVEERYLSRDRWQYWLITPDHKLVHYTKEREELISLHKLSVSDQDESKKKQLYQEDDWQPQFVSKDPKLIEKYNNLLRKYKPKKEIIREKMEQKYSLSSNPNNFEIKVEK